jgi:hypothetical protein
MRWRDTDLRQVLDFSLRERFSESSSTVIRHEVGICEGARRIDVAMINGHFSGWEIKSDYDSLRRLPGQVEAYGLVLDYATLVATERHLAKAVDLVPEWWGVMVATAGDRQPLLSDLRKPHINREVDPMALAQLLWRDEVMAILSREGISRGLSGKARWYVWERLCESYSLRQMRSVVRETLKERQEWPGGQPQRQDDVTYRTPATA